MRLQPFDLVGGFYEDDSRPWSVQDTVNWIPEAAETGGTRTVSMLRDAPGLRPYVEVGEGPIRGLRNVEGKLFCVSGNVLYQISNIGVAIPRGTIPGTGLVSITHNQRNGANQVLVVNGAAGYVYDTNLLTFERITDAGYPGAFVADFIDGYLAQIEPLRRFWFHSELLDALSYNTLDRYPAEGQPDALVTLIVDHREVWVFGERTIEVFVNSGAATNTFTRASNTVIEHGCSARLSPAKLDNSVLWLDDLGIVRRSQGYTATRVSTGAIETAIAALDWSRAFAYTVTDRGHAIYYLTFPDGQTFGYDIVTGLWHRRASYGLNRWRPSAMTYWNGQYIAGDFQRGLLYVMDWDYPYDDTFPHVRRRVTGVTHADQSRVLIPYAEIIAESGGERADAGEAPPQPEGPMITGDAPSGTVSAAYTYTYSTSGGTAPLVVSLAPGSDPLPDGLTLSSLGVLSGTPTTEATYSFTVRVTDVNGLFDDLADTVAIGVGSVFLWDSNPAEYAITGNGTFEAADLAIRAEYIAAQASIRAQSTVPLAGKVYVEYEVANSAAINAGRFYIGAHAITQSTWPDASTQHNAVQPQSSANATVFEGPSNTFSVGAFGWSGTTTGTARVRMAVDVPNRKIWFGINGGIWTDGDPATGTGGYVIDGVSPVYLYGDLDNTSDVQVRRIEIVLPPDWDFAPPAGFS